MVRPRRRRAAAAAAAAVTSKLESHQHHDDDDDDDDEEDDYEFVPGQEENEDEEVAQDGEQNNKKGILEGHLYFDTKTKILHYQGGCFHLQSDAQNDDTKFWNPLLDDPPPASQTAATTTTDILGGKMVGTLSPDGTAENASKERIFDVVWTIEYASAVKQAAAKKASDDDEGDGKPSAKPAAGKESASNVLYQMKATEIDATANVLLELQGGFHPSQEMKKLNSNGISTVTLHTQLTVKLNESAVSSSVPVAAAAAAAAPAKNDVYSGYSDDDDDDDDDYQGDDGAEEEDADEGMGYDELIALHEEAGLNVEDVKRRYQSNNKNNDTGGDDDDEEEEGDGKRSAKKFKSAPQNDGDGDSDDDVGF